MRSRNIKPGFFKNEILGECDPLSRILFAGLWCMADREGRLEDRPKRIKVEILPYDDLSIEDLLNCLVENKFIERYSIDGNNYIAIINWTKHQSPHIKEAPSTIPPPPGNNESTRQAPDKHQTSTEEAALIPDSLNLIPDSNKKPCPPEKQKPADEYSDDFKEFWKHYPRKVQKGNAWKAWKKIKQPKETLTKIQTALIWQKVSDQWRKDNGQFIPHPATYLNARQWEDENDSEPSATPRKVTPKSIEDLYAN